MRNSRLIKRTIAPVLPARKSARYAVLSTNPVIILAPHFNNEQVMWRGFARLYRRLKGQTAFFLFFWAWDTEKPGKARERKEVEDRHLRAFPKHRFFHLCNNLRSMELFEDSGLKAIFCNHNACVDERVFRPLPDIQKQWDAIYDARLVPYKRHHLAAEIDSLALLYDFARPVENIPYAKKIKKAFQHAHFFNHQGAGSYTHLGVEEVNNCLNQCRVGLCLSAVEGAMLASIQYLLAGLPVVSTRSKGGRDVFFEDEYALIVEDNPAAVRQGVQEMIARDIPAEHIRAKTIEKVQEHRENLIALVQKIYEEERVDRDFRSEWGKIFIDKMGFETRYHRDTIRRL